MFTNVGSKEKWLVLLAALLSFLAGTAMAEDIKNVDFDRVSFLITEGAVATQSGSDGNVTLTIDVEKTDWDRVSINGGLDVTTIITAPDTTPDGNAITGHYSVCFGAQLTLEDGLKILHSEVMQYPSSSSTQTEYSNGAGAGVQSGNVLQPTTDESIALICWGDPRNGAYYAIDDAGSASARRYEQARVTIKFSSEELIYLPTHNARNEWLQPTAAYYANSAAVKETVTRHEQMDLYLKDRNDIPDAEKEQPFVLTLAAPEGADQLRITNEWGEKFVSVVDGVARYTDSDLILVRKGSDFDPVSTGRYNLQWLMWEETIAYGDLQVNVIPADHDLCAFYQDSIDGVPMQAVPVSRIHVENQAANCGVKVEQADGMVRYTHDGNISAAGDPGEVVVSIAPNEKYSYYRLGATGGSDMYGHALLRLEMAYESGILQDYHKVNESRIDITGCLPLTTYQAGPMKVYLQTNQITDWLNAGVNLILWYDTEEQAKNGKPSLVEYVCEEETEFCVPIRIDLFNHEHHIKKPVQNITIIKPLGCEWADWKLNMRLDPQKGTNAWHYELFLQSATDALRRVKLPKDQPLVVYMPYPEGYDFASDAEFEVYHFENMDGAYKTLEVLKAEKTAFGLRYEVTSLSPFVLSVAEQPAVPFAVPQTGDNSHIALWLLLLVASAVCMTMMAKRRHV